jgi:hypothetical protein
MKLSNWHKLNKAMLALITWISAASCQMPMEPLPPQACPKPSTSNLSDTHQLQLNNAKTPTFDDDILPLLSSVETGRVYKCTVCHAHYKSYDIVSTDARVDSILSSSGPDGTMPLKGDKITASELNMVRAWRAAGFPKSAANVRSPPPTSRPTQGNGLTNGDPSSQQNSDANQNSGSANNRRSGC